LEFSVPLSQKRLDFSIQAPEQWCRYQTHRTLRHAAHLALLLRGRRRGLPLLGRGPGRGLLRGLELLPGGLGRKVPYSIVSHTSLHTILHIIRVDKIFRQSKDAPAPPPPPPRSRPPAPLSSPRPATTAAPHPPRWEPAGPTAVPRRPRERRVVGLFFCVLFIQRGREKSAKGAYLEISSSSKH
jgi:hypothetical protein